MRDTSSLPALSTRHSSLVHWVFRISLAAEFIGHGAFGLMGKPAWVPYFAVVGIGEQSANPLMRLIGSIDIALGVSALFAPIPAVILYMAVWGLWTAILRPLAGESAWEAVERAGNFGVAAALLALVPRSGPLGWYRRLTPGLLRTESDRTGRLLLRLTTGCLLIGHGALAALERKALFAQHYRSIGLDTLLERSGVELDAFARGVGWFEIGLGFAAMLAPAAPLLLFIVAWKMATELLYITSGYPFWEFVERGGSYGAPLALWLLRRAAVQNHSARYGAAITAKSAHTDR